jgi:type VI protein secretion system component VasK
MKTSLNEARRLQQLAGITEADNKPFGIRGGDGGNNSSSKESSEKSGEESSKKDGENSQSKIDSVGELAKQFNNIRGYLSKGEVNDLSTNEIKQVSDFLQLIINVVQSGEVATMLKKSNDFLTNLTKQ